MTILTNDDKSRIELEEIYRAEVIAKFKENNISKGAGLFAFLNSAFGLWLVTTICVSFGGFLYTSYSNQNDAEEKRQIKIHQLDTEISFRLSQVLGRLHREKVISGFSKEFFPRSAQEDTIVRTDQIYEIFYGIHHRFFAFSYGELEKYSFLGLLLELSRSEKDGNKLEVDKQIKILTVFMDEISSMPDKLNSAEAIAVLIGGKLLIPRWRTTQFPYLDCSSQISPLCDK